MKLIPEGGCHGDRACLESVDECTERYGSVLTHFWEFHVHNVTLSNGEKYRIRTHSTTYGPTETEVKRVRVSQSATYGIKWPGCASEAESVASSLIH